MIISIYKANAVRAKAKVIEKAREHIEIIAWRNEARMQRSGKNNGRLCKLFLPGIPARHMAV